jgi:hypothetical protein
MTAAPANSTVSSTSLDKELAPSDGGP